MPGNGSKIILRWVSGPAGVLVIALSFTWMDWLGIPYAEVPGMLSGLVIFLGTMLGIYLLFYALTGDWLPRLRKSTGRR
jgi:hypothetical protein